MTTPRSHPEDGPLEDALPEAPVEQEPDEGDADSPGGAIVRDDPAPEPNEPG